MVVIAILFQAINQKAFFVLFIGIALGYTLQRSRFCFTASLRDPLLTGGTNLTKAVIIALALSSIGYMAINMSKFGLDMSTYDLSIVAGNIKPVGINTAIGAFLFGIGAVISGGCASGTLMRMGEGFAQQWLAFVFFVIGSVVGVIIMVPMKTVPVLAGKPVFLPAVLGGWIPALILQFGLLALVYLLADWWGKSRN
ncbi:MAG: YeeE/YedE thiosulfate transporter family protein [Actinomycetota bacterium]|nr:YeeE/YedE thiosulfate transporter family protein [Actinomycetota bacterium]